MPRYTCLRPDEILRVVQPAVVESDRLADLQSSQARDEVLGALVRDLIAALCRGPGGQAERRGGLDNRLVAV
jgi:hypothetical protein